MSLIAAAHELKTPLVLIRQLTLQLSETNDTKTRKKLENRIRLTVERSLRLMDGLTKTARLEDAMFKLEPIVINTAVSDTIDEIKPLAEALNQQILIKSRKKATVVGHRDLIRTILLGLIDNSLMSGVKNNKIEVKFRENSEKLTISVRDHGAIIDKKVFDKLFNGVGSRAIAVNDRPLSSGLGLYIAGRFTEYMHGDLTAHRHKTGGMTFDIILPLSNQMELF